MKAISCLIYAFFHIQVYNNKFVSICDALIPICQSMYNKIRLVLKYIGKSRTIANGLQDMPNYAF